MNDESYEITHNKLRAELETVRRNLAVLEAVAPGQLQRIEERITQVAQSQGERLEALKTEQASISVQVERLNQWRFALPIAGVSALLSTISTTIAILQ